MHPPSPSWFRAGIREKLCPRKSYFLAQDLAEIGAGGLRQKLSNIFSVALKLILLIETYYLNTKIMAALRALFLNFKKPTPNSPASN
jgi:hypothetical protein